MKYYAFGEEVHNGEGLLCTAVSEQTAKEIADAMNKLAEEKEKQQLHKNIDILVGPQW
jgi:hypothetical protein